MNFFLSQPGIGITPHKRKVKKKAQRPILKKNIEG